jgi:hypothetical protein
LENPSNYQSYIKSSIALLSVYFYGDQFNTANADYFQTFSALTGWNSTQIDANFRQDGTGMASLAFDI